MMMLRQIRQSRGLTLKQLGELVGRSEASIGLYECGRRKPDFEMLLKLGEVLDCSVDSILGTTFSLSVDEEKMLYLYRLLNEEGKNQVESILLSFSKSPALSQKINADSDGEST